MTLEEFEKRVRIIPTLYTQRHALAMYGIVRWLMPETILEIGSYAGYGTAWLARAQKDVGFGGQVIAIDNYSLGTSASMIHNNLHMLELDNVQLIDADSMKIPNFPSHSVAFIDGNHSLEGITNDWNKCVNAGAECIFIHDTQSWWGPNEFLLLESEQWGRIHVPFDEGFAIYMKNPAIQKPKYTKEQYPGGYV